MQAQILVKRRIEKVLQIDGWRRPAAELKINQRRVVDLLIGGVLEHDVVHPEVAVDERVELVGRRLERCLSPFNQPRSEEAQLVGVVLEVAPRGHRLDERIEQRQVKRVQRARLAIEHSCEQSKALMRSGEPAPSRSFYRA